MFANVFVPNPTHIVRFNSEKDLDYPRKYLDYLNVLRFQAQLRGDIHYICPGILRTVEVPENLVHHGSKSARVRHICRT